jgi:hypothetical protein
MSKRMSISEVYHLLGKIRLDLDSHEYSVWQKHRKLDSESYEASQLHERGCHLQDVRGLIQQAHIILGENWQIQSRRQGDK